MTILERINEKLRNASPTVAQQVLDFVEFLETQRRPQSPGRDLRDYFGVLRDSPAFQEDPVEIQRRLRAEWDRDWDK